MKLLFVDETSSTGLNGNYFAVCAAIIDAKYYCELKKAYFEILDRYKWDKKVEFKGNIIFDPKVEEHEKKRRFNIARDIIGLNMGSKNSKVKFTYVSTDYKIDRKSYYLDCLPLLLDKLLTKATEKDKSAHKNLIGLYCDNFNKITSNQIFNSVNSIIEKKGYVIVEEPVLISHGVNNLGTMYADLFAYFAGRLHLNGRILKNISNEVDLLSNSKSIESVKRSQEIIRLIKACSFHRVNMIE